MNEPLPRDVGRGIRGLKLIVRQVGGDVGGVEIGERGIRAGEDASATTAHRRVGRAPAVAGVTREPFADELPVLLLRERIHAPERSVDVHPRHRAPRTGGVTAHHREIDRLAHDGLVAESVVQVEGLVAHQVRVRVVPVEFYVERFLGARRGEGSVALVACAHAEVGRAVVEGEGAVQAIGGVAVAREQRGPIGLGEGEIEGAEERGIVKPLRLQRAVEARGVRARAGGTPRGVGFPVPRDEHAEVRERDPVGEIGGRLHAPVAVVIGLDAEQRVRAGKFHPHVGGLGGDDEREASDEQGKTPRRADIPVRSNVRRRETPRTTKTDGRTGPCKSDRR